MKQNKRLISECPICDGGMTIIRLKCEKCDSQIDGDIPVPAFFRLPEEMMEFVMVFLQKRGNIREVEKALNISYPTVCKRLDLVNEMLGNTEENGSKTQILLRLERGEINAKEAAKLLRGR